MTKDSTKIRTLYLRNVPSRPENKSHYIRLILSNINPRNKYVLDETLLFPDYKLNLSSVIEPIDDLNGILSISISNKLRLKNQCFITFMSTNLATKFKAKFHNNLNINGRKIFIDLALKDSLIALLLRDENMLKNVLKNRKIHEKLLINGNLAKAQKLRRHVRRVRNKLRTKGMNEDEIHQLLENFKIESLHKREDKKSDNTLKQKEMEVKKKKEPVDLTTNPPNKVLLVQNIPVDIGQQKIADLFNSDGLKEVRLVGVLNLAFVEYNNIENAVEVKNKLGTNYNWNNHVISIAFAK